MARHDDKDLADLLRQFVCVRIVQGWGIDLTLFQFDGELTFCAFLLNADRTVYGRYGTRASGDASDQVSIEGFKKALQGALDLHGAYPGNRKELAGKTGPAPAWKTPEQIPALKGRQNIKPADGSRAGCVHCHQIDEQIWTLRAAKQAIPESMLRRYPMPDVLGFTLDPRERAAVTAVTAGSPADKAGFKTGDRIARIGGQPVISIADVQWVLQQADDGDEIKADLDRGGRQTPVALKVPSGWRAAVPFAWRVFTYPMRHQLLGTGPLERLDAADRAAIGVAEKDMALRVGDALPGWVKNTNPAGKQFQKGDVFVEVDGRTDLPSEDDLLAYLMLKKPAGTKAAVTVLRAGKKVEIPLTMP